MTMVLGFHDQLNLKLYKIYSNVKVKLFLIKNVLPHLKTHISVSFWTYHTDHCNRVSCHTDHCNSVSCKLY